jgi:hypothetical protein
MRATPTIEIDRQNHPALIEYIGTGFTIKDESALGHKVMKKRKCEAALQLANEADLESICFYTSGNVARVYRELVQRSDDYKPELVALVNKDRLRLEVLDKICEWSDRVIDLNGHSAPELVNEPINGKKAYQDVIFEMIIQDEVPSTIYVPFGSGEFAGELMKAARFIAVYKTLLKHHSNDRVKALSDFTSIYCKGEMGSGLSLYETHEFDLIRTECPKISIDELNESLPKFVLCSEENSFLSKIVKMKYGARQYHWVQGTMVLGAETVYFDDDGSDFVADKLIVPQLRFGELFAEGSILRTLDQYPEEKWRSALCSRDEILSAYVAFYKDFRLEPSSAVPFAALKKSEGISEGTCVVSTGSSVFSCPIRKQLICESLEMRDPSFARVEEYSSRPAQTFSLN